MLAEELHLHANRCVRLRTGTLPPKQTQFLSLLGYLSLSLTHTHTHTHVSHNRISIRFQRGAAMNPLMIIAADVWPLAPGDLSLLNNRAIMRQAVHSRTESTCIMVLRTTYQSECMFKGMVLSVHSVNF